MFADTVLESFDYIQWAQMCAMGTVCMNLLNTIDCGSLMEKKPCGLFVQFFLQKYKWFRVQWTKVPSFTLGQKYDSPL